MMEPGIFQNAVESAKHGIYVTDTNGKLLYLNPSFAELTGYTVQELIGRPISMISSGNTSREYYETMWETIRSGANWAREITNRRKDGSLYEAFQIISPVTDRNGTVWHYVGIQHDITEEKEIRRRLDQALLEFDAIFSNTQDAMFLVDVLDSEEAPFRLRKQSPSHARLTGLIGSSVNGKTPREVFGAEQGSELIAHYRRCIELRRPISYEETLDLPVGRRVWQTQLSPVFRGDEIVQLVGSARDVTDQKRLHEELRILSETDALTGVPNRRKISEELDRELSRAQRYGHPMTVLLLDVDKFKTINDELGHDVGDTALRGIARTLASLMRPSDRVGRWGGEEFLILLPETDRTGGRAAAERVRVGIETADVVRDVTITVSIGVAAIGPQRADNPRAVSHTAEGLVATADEELYRAKHAGRNRVSG